MKKKELEEKLKKTEEALLLMAENYSKLSNNVDEETKKIRTEFAKSFGWKEDTKRNTYDYGNDVITWKNPTWEQIFVQVGKLLVSDSFKEIIEQLRFKDKWIMEMDSRLSKLEPKKLNND